MRSFAWSLTRRSSVSSEAVSGPKSALAVWEKYGLRSTLLSERRGDPRFAALTRASRFRLALEELGGLYALFGRFATGRADLLPSPHLRQIRKIRIARPLLARALVEQEFGPRITDVEPVDVRACSEVYRASWRDGPVIIEYFPPDSACLRLDSFEDFSRGMRHLADAAESPLARHHVLERFREWLLLQADIERKRTILENLSRSPQDCITRFPKVVAELQTRRFLVYRAMEGEPVDAQLRAQSPQAGLVLQRVVEGFLEQALLLSLLDADVQLENLITLPEGRVGFRIVPTLAPIPPEWSYELLQYAASAAAANSPRALHMLARMSALQDVYAGEQRLLRELSGLQPELKINVVTPESVTSMENYWRALGATPLRPPFFLELFHREATLLGQYNGDLSPSTDLIKESLWPVLGRILRFRLGEVLSAEKGREWLIGSGLLMLGATRQLGLTLEQIRDNELALVLDQQPYARGGGKPSSPTPVLVGATMALGLFAAALYLSLTVAGSGYRFVAGLVAIVTGLALAILVSKIE